MQEQSIDDFYQLTPDTILSAIESVGLQPEAALLALNSYENRVYQFRCEDGSRWVAKFYRPQRWSDQQILEEHAFALELQQAEIPVVAPAIFEEQTLHHYHSYRFALFPSCGGRAPELEDKDLLRRIGRYLGRIHLVGSSQPFRHRPQINIDDFAIASADFLLSNGFIPAHLDESYRAISAQLIELCQLRFEQIGAVSALRLHGDCHPSNLMITPDGPVFVDLDDCRQGPAVQDLWMLNPAPDNLEAIYTLLEGYEDFFEFDDRELRLIEPLRCMRIMHYAAWLARRWQDPSFQHNFPWFNSVRFWEEHILALKEQLSRLQNN